MDPNYLGINNKEERKEEEKRKKTPQGKLYDWTIITNLPIRNICTVLVCMYIHMLHMYLPPYIHSVNQTHSYQRLF